MKPEDMTPGQLASALTLGFVIVTLIFSSVFAWVAWFVYRSNRKKIGLAQGPTATFGLVDCFAIIGFMFLSVAFIQAVWSSKPDAANLQTIASEPLANQSAETVSVESDTQEGTTSEGSAPGDVPKQAAWGKLTPDRILFSAWVSAAQLIAVFLVPLFIMGRTGCQAAAFGWHPNRFGVDVLIGVWLLFMTMPPMFLMTGVVNGISGVKYEHPVIDTMREYPWMLGIVAFQAVIVAPISEEFFFRSMLIGWFESIHFGKSFEAFLTGWSPTKERIEPLDSTEQFVLPDASQQEKTDPYLPTVANAGVGDTFPQGARCEEPCGYTPPWWPSIVSAILFGVPHFSYGLSWIPLIVFGIILGRIYQWRQSLVSCIAIHMLFNAINLFNLWLSLGLPNQ
jgi:membrane protease YdiL (CAAX protease family)